MDEIISRGKRRNHGLCADIPDEGTSEVNIPLYSTSYLSVRTTQST
jgi:hypothetical protein